MAYLLTLFQYILFVISTTNQTLIHKQARQQNPKVSLNKLQGCVLLGMYFYTKG